MASAKPKKYYMSFKDSYSKEFTFILRSKKGTSYAFCAECGTDFSISHGGKGDIVTHIKSKKHKDSASSKQNNSKIDVLFSASDDLGAIRAECLFTSFILEHNLSFLSADHAGPLFRKMFPDSEIGKKYGCGRTKTTAIVREMAAEEETSIVNVLRKQPFAVATDGSNDTDSKLYPIVVTFFNNSISKVETALLSVPALQGDSTGKNIGNLLVNKLSHHGIPIANCVALGCDNANVMVGKKSGVASVMLQQQENILIMGCLCHLIDLAASRGSDSLPIKIDELLVDVYYYLKKSSKRKDKLKELQILHDTEARKMLKHVETRWLSTGRCLSRIIQQWDPLLNFFVEESPASSQKCLANLDHYKIPKRDVKKSTADECKSSFKAIVSKETKQRNETTKKQKLSDSFKPKPEVNNEKSCRAETVKINTVRGDNRQQRVLKFLKSDLNKAFCYFMQNITPLLENSCVKLQAQEPLIHKLRNIIMNLFKELLSKFVDPIVVKACTNIIEINYHSRKNQKDDINIVIGSATQKIVASLNIEEKSIFFQSVRKYFICILDYMRHSFPFKSDVLNNAEVLDLTRIRCANFSQLKFFLEKFPVMLFKEECETNDTATDVLQSQFCQLQMEDIPLHIIQEKRADTQWVMIKSLKNELGELKYERLAQTMLSVLCIPHSNADCERIFSHIKKIRTQFRSSLSNENLEKMLISKLRQKGHCYEQQFQPSFLKKAKSATTSMLSSSK